MDASSLPLPPGAMGLPLIGETLAYIRDPAAFANERLTRYGRIFKTHLFGRPTISVSGPEDVRFIFANEYRYLRAQWPKSTRLLLGDKTVSTQEGELHKARRKTLQQAFSRHILVAAVPEMDRLVLSHLDRWQAQADLEWAPLLSELTFHIACVLILGVDRELSELSRHFGHWSAGLFALPIPLPWTRFGRAQKMRKLLSERLASIIRERRQAAPASPGGNAEGKGDARDALTALLRVRDENGEPLSDAELCDQALTLMFAGHETTASALTSMALVLVQRPDIFARLRSEQDELAWSGPLTMDGLERMPYMGQVIKEVLRVYPPVAAGFREVIEEFELGGYRVPKGWVVSYSVRNSHADAQSFASPELFEPDRFGPERGEDRRTRFSHIPFGGGPRLCPGMELARLEMTIVGARLVRDYDWVLAPEQDISMNNMPVPRPRSGLRVRLTRRARASAPPSPGSQP